MNDQFDRLCAPKNSGPVEVDVPDSLIQLGRTVDI